MLRGTSPSPSPGILVGWRRLRRCRTLATSLSRPPGLFLSHSHVPMRQGALIPPQPRVPSPSTSLQRVRLPARRPTSPISVGTSVNFSGVCTDPDNNVPLTFLWNFGGGASPSTSTQQNPPGVVFNTSGTFTVSFACTDALGTTDPSPATVRVTVSAVNTAQSSGGGAVVAVVPCAQEARPGSQGSSTYWTTCFYLCWCLASYVCCHVPIDHTDYGNFTRGTYARSRISWGETLRTARVSRIPHQGRARWSSPSKPQACVGVICTRTVPKAGQPPSAFVAVLSQSLPGMNRVAWSRRWDLASARRKPGLGSA